MRTNVLNRFCILNELLPSPLLSLATHHFCFSVCVCPWYQLEMKVTQICIPQ